MLEEAVEAKKVPLGLVVAPDHFLQAVAIVDGTARAQASFYPVSAL